MTSRCPGQYPNPDCILYFRQIGSSSKTKMNLRQSKPARSYPQLRAEAFSESPIRDPLQRCGTWAEPCEARWCSTVMRTLSRTGSRRFCSGNVSGIAALLPILVLSTRLAVWGQVVSWEWRRLAKLPSVCCSSLAAAHALTSQLQC